GEPGDQDSIGINLTNNSGTLLYSSNWNGTSTDELILSGGNIVIHSGFSSLPTSSANQVDSPVFNLSTEENPFDFKAIIELESDDKSAMVTYTVYDGTNKLIFTQVLPPDANFTFGENVRSGMYLVVVQQGGKVGQIRMIKE
ncbi:MAG: T9SS type A sorting domain-containing protein, partial [Flavobacteriaceae bacterium]|nr:T9SS type A sorting domain-containing protein [Flavobacteriaceae bacterium]